MDLNGYSAWISVDGTALKEYNIEVSNGNNATCWIASEAGKASRSCVCFDEFHSPKPGTHFQCTEFYRELERLKSHQQNIWVREIGWHFLWRKHSGSYGFRCSLGACHYSEIVHLDFDYDGETLPFLAAGTHRSDVGFCCLILCIS